ncbi:hypothetical protein L1987_86869 [Smallanthus sonchifolius]|uniref:Uncharacterized protein n=1 Tax=Smallanthus sonchifolius TaxID=185202 RepID=A0ACB8Y142_9ASTR|nr:hypothetical protein L1987_86869 [Smallanthus sonchifolius]
MPWVGLYIGVASFICAFAMAADAVHAIWQWKLWFQNRFFTLNASTITLIAIAMKLPMDLNLTTDRCEGTKVSPGPCSPKVHNNPGDTDYEKMSGMSFLVTMLANFLPSLGLMDDKEVLINTVALGILFITIAVNIGIQLYTQVLFLFPETIPIYLFAFLWPFSVALTVSTPRKKLEHRYNESRQLVSSHQEKMFSSKGLKNYVKKYWMMTETRNPHFVIACSPFSSAFGVICLYLAFVENTRFNGIQDLNNEKVQPLYPEETHNCWSLVVVTLTSIALALPNIANDHFKVLVASMSESLLIVRHIEECLNTDDLLSACFTNLPHVIKMKCHHHAIEKMGENIRNAAQLRGKSKKILKVLKARQLPNIDLYSRAYIDKWCVLLKSQIPNGSVSSHGIQQGSSSCNESLIVSIIE